MKQDKMLSLIAAYGKESLMKYLEDHSSCSNNVFNDQVLLDLVECFYKGGAGSGCRGDNCGRKPSSSPAKPTSNPSNEIIRVGTEPVNISQGGARSGGVPKYEEFKPRKEEDIKADYINAARELQAAEATFNQNRNTENSHAVNRARSRVRELIREARLARDEAKRQASKA